MVLGGGREVLLCVQQLGTYNSAEFFYIKQQLFVGASATPAPASPAPALAAPHPTLPTPRFCPPCCPLPQRCFCNVQLPPPQRDLFDLHSGPPPPLHAELDVRRPTIRISLVLTTVLCGNFAYSRCHSPEVGGAGSVGRTAGHVRQGYLAYKNYRGTSLIRTTGVPRL